MTAREGGDRRIISYVAFCMKHPFVVLDAEDERRRVEPRRFSTLVCAALSSHGCKVLDEMTGKVFEGAELERVVREWERRPDAFERALS
jgi:hypothetical protein